MSENSNFIISIEVCQVIETITTDLPGYLHQLQMILLGCFLVPTSIIIKHIACIKYVSLKCLHFQTTNEDTNRIISHLLHNYTIIGQ